MRKALARCNPSLRSPRHSRMPPATHSPSFPRSHHLPLIFLVLKEPSDPAPVVIIADPFAVSFSDLSMRYYCFFWIPVALFLVGVFTLAFLVTDKDVIRIRNHRQTVCNTSSVAAAPYACTDLTFQQCHCSTYEQCSNMTLHFKTGRCCVSSACYVEDCWDDCTPDARKKSIPNAFGMGKFLSQFVNTYDDTTPPSSGKEVKRSLKTASSRRSAFESNGCVQRCRDVWESNTKTFYANNGTCSNMVAIISYTLTNGTTLTISDRWWCSLDDFGCWKRHGSVNNTWPCWYDVRDPAALPLKSAPSLNVTALVFLVILSLFALAFIVLICFYAVRDFGLPSVKKLYTRVTDWAQQRRLDKLEEQRLLKEYKENQRFINSPNYTPAWVATAPVERDSIVNAEVAHNEADSEWSIDIERRSKPFWNEDAKPADEPQ